MSKAKQKTQDSAAVDIFAPRVDTFQKATFRVMPIFIRKDQHCVKRVVNIARCHGIGLRFRGSGDVQSQSSPMFDYGFLNAGSLSTNKKKVLEKLSGASTMCSKGAS